MQRVVWADARDAGATAIAETKAFFDYASEIGEFL